MADFAQYASTPNLGIAVLSTANPNRDGTTGAYVDAFVAGPKGSRVDLIEVVAPGPTTAGWVRLFLSTGSLSVFWREILVTPATPSESVSPFTAKLPFSEGLNLNAGMKIKASTEKGEALTVFVRGGDL